MPAPALPRTSADLGKLGVHFLFWEGARSLPSPPPPPPPPHPTPKIPARSNGRCASIPSGILCARTLIITHPELRPPLSTLSTVAEMSGSATVYLCKQHVPSGALF